MRHHFQAQPDLLLIPIEKIRLPLKSRDELPPILAGLQWIWMHPTLKADLFALLEAKLLGGKQATGRTGMDLCRSWCWALSGSAWTRTGIGWRTWPTIICSCARCSACR